MIRRNVIKIGISLSLTGAYSMQGKSAYEGIRTWVDRMNQSKEVWPNNDIRFQLLAYDDQSNSKGVRRNLAKLIEEDNIYILESFHPNKYVARNLGEIKLFYPNLTLTDKFYIFEGGGNIESTIYTENVQGEIIYKSKLLKDWECKKLHNIKSNFPLESYKINPQNS